MDAASLGRSDVERPLPGAGRRLGVLGAVPPASLGEVAADVRGGHADPFPRRRLGAGRGRLRTRSPRGDRPDGMLGLSVTSALASLLLYPVLWSPSARVAISPEIVETLWETPREPSGCSGIIYALGVSFAVLLWFSVLQITWLSTLVAMGLIRSI